jgi:hypothetical protein
MPRFSLYQLAGSAASILALHSAAFAVTQPGGQPPWTPEDVEILRSTITQEWACWDNELEIYCWEIDREDDYCCNGPEDGCETITEMCHYTACAKPGDIGMMNSTIDGESDGDLVYDKYRPFERRIFCQCGENYYLHCSTQTWGSTPDDWVYDFYCEACP